MNLPSTGYWEVWIEVTWSSTAKERLRDYLNASPSNRKIAA